MHAPRRMTISGALWTAVLGMAMTRSVGGIEWLTVWTIVVAQAATVATLWLVGQHLVERTRADIRSDTKRLLEKHRAVMIEVGTDLATKYNMDAEKVARVLAETMLEDDDGPRLSRV